MQADSPSLRLPPYSQQDVQPFEPQFSHHCCSDFDEQASLLQDWNQQYNQLSAGAFGGFLSSLILPDLSLFVEYSNQKLYQQGYITHDCIAIGIPLQGMQNAVFCGQPCQPNSIHLYSGSQGFEFISSAGLMIGIIVIATSTLRQLMGATVFDGLQRQCGDAGIYRLSPYCYQRLVSFFCSTFALAPASIDPPIPLTPSNRTLNTAALNLVVACLADPSLSKCTVQTKGYSIVSQTHILLHTQHDAALTVAQVSQQLGISRRTLQYYYQQTLDTSPLAFMRAERLNGVRHTLKSSHTVTEAATEWGFCHFGHFASEYKKMFGELPSTTFQRMHQSTAN